MKKRIVSIVLVIMLMTMVACGKKADTAASVDVTSTTDAAVELNKPAKPEESAAENKETTPVSTQVEEQEIPEAEGVEYWYDEETESVEETEKKNTESNSDIAVPEKPAKEENVPKEEPAKSEGCGCQYGEYLALTPVQQQEYMGTFSSPMAFIEWCKNAEEEHSNHVTVIEASGNTVDIGDYIQ